jgi:CheY-like chemotaxis protein
MNAEGNDSSTKATILAVDDNPANLSILTNLLREHGYDARPAISGILALRGLEMELPDLILLDFKMPEMDGYEVRRRLKADERSRDVPVIFIICACPMCMGRTSFLRLLVSIRRFR